MTRAASIALIILPLIVAAFGIADRIINP